MRGCRELLGSVLLSVSMGLQAGVTVPPKAPGPPEVCLARVKGAIGPATATYLARARTEAVRQGAQCLIIELDTPGGLLEATKEIIQGFLESPLPTVVYVSPPGAWAGSAGCFITLAADVAAMAPTTSIGAAHPVGIGPSEGAQDDVMKKKLENFTSSYIEAIAGQRHRNTEWAKASVHDSASVTADEALRLHVIDLIATDLPDLLTRLDGRDIAGKRLHTQGARVVVLPMTPREAFLQTVAHPQVMLVLMLVVMYGIIGELTSPGAILPGVAGSVALVLLLYLASVLPMSLAGIALVGLAITLFLIDGFAPTHGVLTLGGILAFFLGLFMLFDRGEPFLRLSLAWILPATMLTSLFFIFIAGAGLRAQREPPRTGAEAMIGQRAVTLERIDAAGGRVRFEGEVWKAASAEPIDAGQAVAIVARDGLNLKVVPIIPPKEAPP